MIAINLSGIQANEKLHNLGLENGQVVTVKHHPEWDDNEKALAIHDEMGNQIGWIPKLETIVKYGKNAKELGNVEEAQKQRDRYSNASFIRDHVWTDMYRNHINVEGKICRVQHDFDTGNIMSVSVMFDYM